jgi:hypothetical protein
MTNYKVREDSRKLVLATRSYWLGTGDQAAPLARGAWDSYQFEAARHERMHREYYGGTRSDAWRRPVQ